MLADSIGEERPAAGNTRNHLEDKAADADADAAWGLEYLKIPWLVLTKRTQWEYTYSLGEWNNYR